MVAQHYRWDFIGLSTDEKPTPATSEKVVNGSTFYCSDNSKLYVYYKDQWYERKPLGGGGTTYTDFIGTDGEEDGEAGLVPAPLTTDVGKYLKSDGTWAEVSGGGTPGAARVLTADDYNYPETGTKTMVRLDLLDEGMYYVPSGISIGIGKRGTATKYTGGLYLVGKRFSDSDYATVIEFGYNPASTGGAMLYSCSLTSSLLSYDVITSHSVVNDLTTTAASLPLSATQGKVLKGYVDNLTPLTGDAAPTSATVGALGQTFIDTTNEDVYICTSYTGSPAVYTWKKISLT